ncbi:hypothetical protein [Streptomyces sp. NPDC059063]|uniref:hypothetical protein n=1 Tax=Streptomyces sp. NPDC059063 TaxID=3346712 RepID=UPI0036C8371A
MTGPEHYKEAERLSAMVQRHPDSSDAVALAILALAEAQLAHAAATALNDNHPQEGGMPLDDLTAWREAAGTYASSIKGDDR